jgi:hypothetical protein
MLLASLAEVYWYLIYQHEGSIITCVEDENRETTYLRYILDIYYDINGPENGLLRIIRMYFHFDNDG